jgi:hypothetical protein
MVKKSKPSTKAGSKPSAKEVTTAPVREVTTAPVKEVTTAPVKEVTAASGEVGGIINFYYFFNGIAILTGIIFIIFIILRYVFSIL